MLANCSPYLTGLQYISNLETKRSRHIKGQLMSRILFFGKKSIEKVLTLKNCIEPR